VTPRLKWGVVRGDRVGSTPARVAHLPWSWFLTCTTAFGCSRGPASGLRTRNIAVEFSPRAMILRGTISLLVQFVLFLGCGSPPGTTSADSAGNAPTTITVGGTGDATAHSVALSWKASISNDVVGYYVYRGTQPGPPYTAFTKLTPSPISATTYMDSAVDAGATYYYVVTAVNGNGKESTYSNQASATIASP
jgi:hypothetical protein